MYDMYNMPLLRYDRCITCIICPCYGMTDVKQLIEAKHCKYFSILREIHQRNYNSCIWDENFKSEPYRIRGHPKVQRDPTRSQNKCQYITISQNPQFQIISYTKTPEQK